MIYIVVTCLAIGSVFVVTTPSAEAATPLQVSMSAWTPNPVGQSKIITIKIPAKYVWSIKSEVNWISTSKASGKVSGNLTLKAARNPAITARVGIINVTAKPAAGGTVTTKRISVTQKGAGWVTASKVAVKPSYKAGSEAFFVYSNWASWTAKSNSKWLTVTPKGKSNTSARLAWSANTSKTNSRTATVTFTAGLSTAKITVSQAADPRVATLTLISASNGEFTDDHAYLLVTNTSKSNLNIAGYNLGSGKAITIGSFGNKPDGKGVYFNLEAYLRFSTGYSIANPGLTVDNVKTLSKYIKDNNKWYCFSNCSAWASIAWNQFADTNKKVSAGNPATPANLKQSIGKLPGYQKNIKLPTVKKSEVLRLGTDGKLKTASAKSINTGSFSSGSSGSLPFAVCF